MFELIIGLGLLLLILAYAELITLRDRFEAHIRDDKRHRGIFGKNKGYKIEDFNKDQYISKDNEE